MDPFKLRAYVGYGTGSSFVGSPWGNVTNFSGNLTAYISAIWQATAQFGIAGTFGYASSDLDPVFRATRAGAKLIWTPVPGFTAYAEGSAWKLYSGQDQHNWEAQLGFKREF
jgi:hypothetical protein